MDYPQALPQSELYLYHDANMAVSGTIPKTPFRIIHHKRVNIKQEALALIANNNRWEADDIKYQLEEYTKDSFDIETGGLLLNGFFIRPNSEVENRLGELMVEQLNKYTSRDMLALPYLLDKHNIKLDYLVPFKDVAKFFRMSNHQKMNPPKYTNSKKPTQEVITSTTPKIFYITPARSDKNFGKAINDHIELLPEDAWIVLRDADTTFLTPDYVKQIEDIVNNYGHEYDLIGCYTNRIGLKYQLLNGELSEDVNIKNHIKIAKEQFEKYGSKTVPLHKNIAGFFMLFSKKAWNEHKFDEGLFITKSEGGRTVSGYIDYWFSNYFAKKKRVGIAKGLYVFHVYRLFHENRQVQTHLR